MKKNSPVVRSSSVYLWLKNNPKWLAPILPYLAVWAGLFLVKSAWVALIGFHVTILFALLIAHPNIPINILFRSKHPKWVILSILLGASGGLGLYLSWNLFGIARDIHAQLQVLGLVSSWPIFIAYFALINPFVEEYFWRAFLGSTTKTLYISDLIYAGFHGIILINKVPLPSITFALAILTFIGWFWRQLYRKDDGLLAAVLGHMAADFTILLTVYRMSSL